MKVLLRDEEARLYYRAEHVWVADPSAAMDFHALERAGQIASDHGDQTLTVVLRYEDPECELALNPAFCIANRQPGIAPGQEG